MLNWLLRTLGFVFFAWAITGAVWIGYLAAMMLKQHLSELRWFHLQFAYPFAAIFIVADFLFRVTLGSLMFLDLPDRDTLLFTGLCKRHHHEQTWRGKLARFWCEKFLDPFAEGGHC